MHAHAEAKLCDGSGLWTNKVYIIPIIAYRMFMEDRINHVKMKHHAIKGTDA